MSMSHVAEKTGIPPQEIEAQEIGLKPFDCTIYGRLIVFYNLKTEALDIPKDNFKSFDD